MFQGLFIDGFAGGGGASTGIAQAIGREVDIAVNHSEAAIAVHKANHPGADHYCQDIRAVWPRQITRNRRVAGAWFSPDCKEFSKAKGGSVKERHIRMLANEIPHWLDEAEPEVVYVENVEEFEDWGPLEEGADGKWRVIVDRKGEDFKRWVRMCRARGYRVAWKQLRACDYGAPTSRNRLYIVMRRDKRPIVWPKPTHGKPDSPGVKGGRLLPYRTAAECIDWTIRCPSIFDRKKDLADATLRRIAHGVMRYVVNCARPFIIPVTHQGGVRVYDIEEPKRTVTGAHRGEFAVADAELVRAPHITKFYTTGIGAPMDGEFPTVTANGGTNVGGATPLGMAEATLAPFVTYAQHGGANRPATDPHHTIAASDKDQNCVAAATMVQIGWGEREGQAPRALDVEKPLGTTPAGGCKHAAVTAELAYIDKQYGKSVGAPVDAPAPGATTHAKSAAVTAFLSAFYGSDKRASGGEPKQPLRTARAGGTHHAVVAAHIEQANTGMVGHTPRKPISTIVGKGCTQRIVETTMVEDGALPPELMARAVRTAAFLVKYYATDGENEVAQSQPVDRPLDCVTTKARFAVVTVTIDAVTYVIVDIGMRMLTPRELARAQGFPEDYILDPVCWYVTDKGNRKYGRLPKSLQIAAIGNSVCPPVARALVAANQPGLNDNEHAVRRAA